MEGEPKTVLTRDSSCQTEHSHPDCWRFGTPIPNTGLQTPVRPVEPGDSSTVQKQTLASMSGIEQIIECFHSGTLELVNTLLREVDTIFECKLCRSLFRGLPNLVRHKEFFCFSRLDQAAATSPADQNRPMKKQPEVVYQQKDRPVDVAKQGTMSSHDCVEKPSQPTELETSQGADSEHGGLEERPGETAEEEEVMIGDSNCVVKEFSLQEMEEVTLKGAEEEAEEEKGSKKGAANRVSCRLCGEDFSSLCGVRQHCLRLHKQNPKERLWRLTEVLPVGGRRSHHPPGTAVCGKPFVSRVTAPQHLDSEQRASDGGSSPPRQHKTTIRRTRVLRKARPSRKGDQRTASGRAQPDATQSVCEAGGKSKTTWDAQSLRLGKSKLQMGFDFKQHYCRLCMRQFTSDKNLKKHIEQHVEGDEIFIKFYRCPLCVYESRRKYDLARHMKVVHKKMSSYLDKVMPKVESQPIKKPAEMVLSKQTMRCGTSKAGRSGRGHRQVTAWAPPPHRDTSAVGSSTTIEGGAVRKARRKCAFHACDVSGPDFARKLNVEVHRRSHITAGASNPQENQRRPRTRSRGAAVRSPQWMLTAS